MKRLLGLTALLAALCYGAGGLGLGVMAGDPNGLSAKYWTGERTAFDAAAAWSYWGYGGAALHLHGDFLLHQFEWLKVPSGELPVYIGVGARLKLVPDHLRLGVRVPFGAEYIFAEIPVGLFLEVAPGIDVIPETKFFSNGAVGARWYFR